MLCLDMLGVWLPDLPLSLLPAVTNVSTFEGEKDRWNESPTVWAGVCGGAENH